MKFNEVVGFKLESRIKTLLLNYNYYPYHIHENVLELVCVLDGSITVYDGPMNYTLNSNDVFIINPKRPHKYVAEEDNVILIVQIDLNYYNHFFESIDLINDTFFICDSFQEDVSIKHDLKYLRFLMAKLYRECSADTTSDSRIEMLGKELIENLLRDFQYYIYEKGTDGEGYYKIQRTEVCENSVEAERMNDIMNMVDMYFSEKLTLEYMANKYYLTPSYLSRFIKKSFGMSFSDLISLRRCEAAKQLLCMTEKTVDQTAYEVGFAGRNNLSKQFQKWYGKKPTEYRKNIRDDLKRDIDLREKKVSLEITNCILEEYLSCY